MLSKSGYGILHDLATKKRYWLLLNSKGMKYLTQVLEICVKKLEVLDSLPADDLSCRRLFHLEKEM